MRHFTFFLVLSTAWLLQPRVAVEPDSLTPSERFGLELQLCAQAQAAGMPEACTLFGRIQVVDSFPDVKVRKVNARADIDVQVVDSFPNKPGKWQFVTSFPDYKVQLVDRAGAEHYTVRMVDAFPKCNKKP